MKILKKLMCCCLFVMLLCSHGMTAYALEIQDGTAVKLIVTDETGGFSGQIVAEFYDSDSAEQVYTAVLTKENSWGGQADFTFNLDPNKTYSIMIKGLPSDYLLVNTFGDRGQVQSITVSSLAMIITGLSSRVKKQTHRQRAERKQTQERKPPLKQQKSEAPTM